MAYIEPKYLPIRKDLLYRLRWNIFSSLSDIQITTGPITITIKDNTEQITNTDISQTTLVPLFESDLRDKSLFNPPLTRIDEVNIAQIVDQQSWYEARDVYSFKAPAPLMLENTDNAPITLGQFVKAVHAYLNLHEDAIKKIKGETYGRLNESGGRTITYGEHYLPDGIGFWFHRVFAAERQGKIGVSVDVLAEGELMLRHGLEMFWEWQLRTAKRNELGYSTM
jgi:hypothetical protein